MNLDIIGKIYSIDDTDPGKPVATPLDGWHVNTTAPVSEWEHWRVEPSHKTRVFAGVATYCYKFDSEEQFNEVNHDGAV